MPPVPRIPLRDVAISVFRMLNTEPMTLKRTGPRATVRVVGLACRLHRGLKGNGAARVPTGVSYSCGLSRGSILGGLMNLRRFRLCVVVGLGLLAPCLVAEQPVTLGNLGTSNFAFGIAQITAMDLNHPAQSAGRVTTASFTWSAAPCPAAATVKFFRPVVSGAQTGTFVMYARRGPFDVTTTSQTVSLSPVVAVQPNDTVAITNATACGGPTGHQPGSGSAGYVSVPGDVTQIAPPVVTDQVTGRARTYTNSASVPGQLCGGADTDAFRP